MTIWTFAAFGAGVALLVLGAEWLVRGASRIAIASGISPLVIGLTVVAYGTSAPELAVSIKASWSGEADLALGNVVGSNIFNILLILGVSAAITPLRVAGQLIRLDVPLMIGLSVLVWAMALDGRLGRVEGALLVAGAIGYTALLLRIGRSEPVPDAAINGDLKSTAAWTPNLLLIAAGLAGLVLGSRWLVDSAVVFAAVLGVSELVIGLTIVAAGTSLPEVATSIVAAMRGERDIAVGNVVGSNIFNILTVLGVSAAISRGGLAVAPALLNFDLPVMVVVAIACLPIFARGASIERWEGLVFLFYYGAYTIYVVLAAQQHDALPAFSAIMRTFAIPLTVLTLVVVSWRHWRRPAA
jgi:cation:H+ antiporter